MAGE
ncbi:hypothetical protein VCHC51A1_1810, partial [Vibrio cholerae HC-51A1]|jgi:hypothetical protein